MAEAAVGLVIDKLIPLLTEEAYLLRGVHQEVEEIKCDLDYILAFLNDADTRAESDQRTNNSHGVKIWVQKLRKAAFELEDVIDEYTHLMAQQQRPHKHRFIGFLRRNAFLLVKLKSRHDIALKIQDIKRRVRDINQKSAVYGFNSLPQGAIDTPPGKSWSDPRKDSCFLKETEVVGIESARAELIESLEGESCQRSVIAVVGMGGVGKTTLVHQVYEHVNGCFDCHAWIEVSQSYNKVELLRSLISKICQARGEFAPEGIDAMNERAVTTELSNYLQGKSYVVVFDDVWNINFWADIKNALPDNNRCGRIVITTRDVEVANFCRTTSFVYIRHLKPLPPEKAWELFCNRAFHSECEKDCPTYLKELSWKIVERCEGLPLAIVVIAGLLSTKNKSVEQWKKLHDSLSSELDSNEHLTSITRILSFSYNDLPYYLKSCFLYFGIFPEEYSIKPGRLTRQWVAEGFVRPKKDKSLEIVAEEYLVELINRNLVQVPRTKLDGKAKSCRIHDLLREIILKKMEDLGFCQVLSQSYLTLKRTSQRLSIIHSSFNVLSRNLKLSHVRSIFTFNEDNIPRPIVSTVINNFKLLKVLDFEGAPCLDYLPKDIGNLFHLRYLSVRRTRVQLLPKSIGKLENLETLDLKQSQVSELPVEVNKLHKLRHLLAYHIEYKMDSIVRVQRGVKVEKGIGWLKALQKLYFVEANIEGFDLFKELCKLTELRKLGIKKLRSEDSRTLCDCIGKMEHLESLSIASISEDETINMESMSSPPQFLRHLNLDGHLRKFPEWIAKLQNLVRIRFGWSKLEDDPLKGLQNLHNLLELGIYYDAYCGKQLHFEGGTFQKLKVFYLSDLSMLDSIVIEEEALCDLERFLIGSCPQLVEVPCGLQHLRNLKVLGFIEMPTKFLMFQDFQSLHAVPKVRFAHKVNGEYTAFGLESLMMIQEIMRRHNEVEWDSWHFEGLLSKVLEKVEVTGALNRNW
ncbi:disease resistance protein RPM1 [Morus notabilis]|uniref:disease resistance protein RPM1 n=1 Tax=Morus notabilis TaxID=981085 RepID=UPI000CED4010|nr:disease resistance protein RPM1 [Morus notabilis]